MLKRAGNSKRAFSNPESILIVKLGSIGDVVHTLPVLNALRSGLPDTRIGWVVERTSAGLLEGHSSLDELIVFERDRERPLATIQAFAEVVGRLRRANYEMSLDIHGNIRSGLMSFLSGAPRRLGFTGGSSRIEPLNTLFSNRRVPEGNRPHIIERNLSFVSALGLNGGEISFRLPVNETSRGKARNFLASRKILGRLIILHPGSEQPAKRWAPENYSSLIDAIGEDFKDMAIILTGGEREHGLLRKILSMSRLSPVIADCLGISELAALLEGASLVIASDTGPLHIASALGRKVIGLYGPTEPGRNGPYGSGSVVIRKSRLVGDITVADVLERVRLCLGQYRKS